MRIGWSRCFSPTAWTPGAIPVNARGFKHGANYRGAAGPTATGRTGDPEAPCVPSGRMMVQDSHTLSLAMAAEVGVLDVVDARRVRFW